MRSYAGFRQEEIEQVYSVARAGVPDDVICRRYDIDEDFLLRVDSGEDGAVARRCSLVHESADACSHAPGFFEIAVVDGLRDSAALVSLGVEFEIVGALR